jgi:hypothetical protein
LAKKFWDSFIEYQTVTRSDGKKDHTPLLRLLDSLKTSETKICSSTLVLSPDFILSLNRHAAKYYGFETSRFHLPLVVHPIENNKRIDYHSRFYELLLKNFSTMDLINSFLQDFREEVKVILSKQV